MTAAAWTRNRDVKARLESIAKDPEDDTYGRMRLHRIVLTLDFGQWYAADRRSIFAPSKSGKTALPYLARTSPRSSAS